MQRRYLGDDIGMIWWGGYIQGVENDLGKGVWKDTGRRSEGAYRNIV